MLFDQMDEESLFGENTWEAAESKMQKEACLQALEKAAQALGLGEVAPCGAGLYCLLRVGGKTPAQELIPLAARAGVRLTRLADYGVMQQGQESERVVLLGFAGMDENAIEEGLGALRRAWM